MSRRIITAGAALVALTAFATTASALDLNTKRGYRELGGAITVTFENDMPQAKGAESISGTKLTIAPQFGYFIMDGLEFLGVFELDIPFGEKYENVGTEVGVQLGIEYFFRLAGPVRPYLGILVGMDFHVPADTKANRDADAKTTKDFNLTIPLGILIPLFNEHVAADVGLRFTYQVSLEGEEGTDHIVVPLGYLGVRCFW